MKICILSVISVVLLTNDSYADEQTNQSNVNTSYDPGDITSEAPIGPRLPTYGQITADDHPDHHPEHHGHIRFEDHPSERPLKFDDDPKEHGYDDIDKADASSVLVDISFDNEDSSNQNDRVISTFEGESDSETSEKRIKFEGSNDERHDLENDEGEDPQSGSGQVVFEDDVKSDEDDPDYSHEPDTEIETTDKPIKFENQDNEPDTDTKNRESDKNAVTERVVFKDDNNKNQEPVQKKRKQRRKPRFQSKQSNPAPVAPNLPYPSLGYPGYPGVGYPGPGYPGPGDPNMGYPGYSMPSYPTPGYPYPGYTNPYPSMAYPTPSYPGYSSYPTMFPPMTPGYGAYPPLGYQVPGDQRPTANPVAYPSGHTDTRYPNQEYAGSQSPVTQSGQPGLPYPAPDYPYHQGYPVPGYPQVYPGDPNAQYSVQSQAQYRPPGLPWAHQQGYQNGHNRPSRRPKSLTQRAVSAVAEALTSIALYDDYQCVPRILCEVAGGSTTSSPTLLKATASLQPLLSVLQTYNGVSSSPLFIFGRAAVTGVTAKGNPSVCHRAYPQCPSDPEKLINYLNNHNGGFFRFFGQPEVPQQPQNLEQFYNYLSGQYGFQKQPQQNYGFPSPYGYGLQGQNPHARPQNYGLNYYNEQSSYRNSKNIDSEIEERIQNKPGVNVLEDENELASIDDQSKGSKWSFPDEASTKKGNEKEKEQVKITKPQARPPRVSKTLKFPDDRSDDMRQTYRPRDYPRKTKSIFFPGESNFQLISTYQTTTLNPDEYVFDHKHNFYVKRPKAMKNDDVVYVVRGNGDPYHPEIVKVRPGQSV